MDIAGPGSNGLGRVYVRMYAAGIVEGRRSSAYVCRALSWGLGDVACDDLCRSEITRNGEDTSGR